MKYVQKSIYVFALAYGMFFYSCNEKTASENSQELPEQVVETIFEAAKSGDYEALSGLCDPQGENDGDTKKLCDLSDQPTEMQESFKEYFSKGKIEGEPSIEGDKARVNIKFGPDGTKEETMNLVQRDGKWYLSSF